MASVGCWAKADVVEISPGLSLSKERGHGILKLIEERRIADDSAAL